MGLEPERCRTSRESKTFKCKPCNCHMTKLSRTYKEHPDLGVIFKTLTKDSITDFTNEHAKPAMTPFHNMTRLWSAIIKKFVAETARFEIGKFKPLPLNSCNDYIGQQLAHTKEL